jgi:hypothetical protein
MGNVGEIRDGALVNLRDATEERNLQPLRIFG